MVIYGRGTSGVTEVTWKGDIALKEAGNGGILHGRKLAMEGYCTEGSWQWTFRWMCRQTPHMGNK